MVSSCCRTNKQGGWEEAAALRAGPAARSCQEPVPGQAASGVLSPQPQLFGEDCGIFICVHGSGDSGSLAVAVQTPEPHGFGVQAQGSQGRAGTGASHHSYSSCDRGAASAWTLSAAAFLVPAFFPASHLSLCRSNWKAGPHAAQPKQGAKCHLLGLQTMPLCRDGLGPGTKEMVQIIICEGWSTPGTSPWFLFRNFSTDHPLARK